MTAKQRETIAKHAEVFPAKTLHELLALGLQGLEKAEKTKSPVKPNMGVFHYNNGHDQFCFACLAGLAYIEGLGLNMRELRFRLAVSQHDMLVRVVNATGVSYQDAKKTIYAVEDTMDRLRLGQVDLAFRHWYGYKLMLASASILTDKFNFLAWVSYQKEPKLTKANWYELWHALKEANL
jgi:hypothetical protein